ncbi:hypothetical protein QL996_12310 [Planococcus sp. APC 4015]|nr:hypothetical protein [Planococcus sp. APC 4015]
MTARPSLTRSIPFWGLVAGSVASAAAGAVVMNGALSEMTAKLLDGTATGVEVYVGQPIAVVGGILIGAGVIGVLLALTVAALSTLRPTAPVEIVEPLDFDDDETILDEEPLPASVTDSPADQPITQPAR